MHEKDNTQVFIFLTLSISIFLRCSVDVSVKTEACVSALYLSLYDCGAAGSDGRTFSMCLRQDSPGSNRAPPEYSSILPIMVKGSFSPLT